MNLHKEYNLEVTVTSHFFEFMYFLRRHVISKNVQATQEMKYC